MPTTFQAHISTLLQSSLSIDADSVYIQPSASFETIKGSSNVLSGHWAFIAYNAGNATERLENVQRAGRRDIDHTVGIALANIIEGVEIDTLALLEAFIDAVNESNTFKRADSHSASGTITRYIQYESDTAVETSDNYTYFIVNYTERGQ